MAELRIGVLGLLAVLASVHPVAASAAERTDNIGPYAYIYLADWSRLRHQAELGDPDALFRIDNLYFLPPENSGIGQSYRKAFLSFFQAALNGHATAQHNVGAMYINGDYVKQDMVEGYAWLLVAAQNGDPAGKRKLSEYQGNLTELGHEHAESRAREVGAMIAEAQKKRDFNPEHYGIR